MIRITSLSVAGQAFGVHKEVVVHWLWAVLWGRILTAIAPCCDFSWWLRGGEGMREGVRPAK